MKTIRTKTLFALILFSAVMPSIIFSAEEEGGVDMNFSKETEIFKFTTFESSAKKFSKLMDDIFMNNQAKGQKRTKKLLKGSHLNPNATDQFGHTLLTHAVTRNNPTIVQVLIEANADVNYRDGRGFTALHWAAHTNKLDCRNIVKLLFKNGADSTIEDNNGNTPATTARERNNHKVLELLQSKNVDVKS